MASVEELKIFEAICFNEATVAENYNKLLNNYNKGVQKLEKLKLDVDQARLDWNEWQVKKSQQFDKLIHTSQNL